MEHDDMIEALAANRSNHSFYIGSLPRRPRCGQNFADAHVSHLFSEVIAQNRIAVAQQVAPELGKGKYFTYKVAVPSIPRLGERSH
jgi:hypothetical protein